MLETRAGGPVLQDSAMAGAGGPGRRGHYVGFDLGVSSPTDSKFSGLFNSAQASFDTGFTIGAAYGYHYTDKLRVEADLGYRKSDLDKVTIGGVTLDGSGDMSTLTLLANGYYDFDLGGPVAPYVGFGFGMAIVDVDTSDTESRVSVDDSGTTFAFNLMAGVSYGVGDNVDLDLGYRYLGAIDPELDATFAPGGILGGGTTTVNVDVEVHEIFLGMRYTF